MATKTKERSAAELRRDREALAQRRAALEAQREEFREEIRADLRAGRNPEKAQATLEGIDQQLKRVDEQLAALQDLEAAAAAQDVAAERQGAAGRADTLARTLAAETAGVVQDLREALAAPMARLEGAEKVHAELQALWQDLDRGEFLGGRLGPLRYLVDQLVGGLRAMEEGTR
jgi:hypothetical protein